MIHLGSRAGPRRRSRGLGVWADLSSWLCVRSFPVMTSPQHFTEDDGGGVGRGGWDSGQSFQVHP